MKKKLELDIELPREALEAYRFAHEEGSRPELTNIRIEVSKEGVGKNASRFLHAVTTDGHRMLHVKWLVKEKDIINASWCIEAGAAETLLGEYKRPKKGEAEYVFRLFIEGDDLLLGPTEACVQAAPADQGDAKYKFPEWKHMIPKPSNKNTENGPSVFGIDLDYLLDFKKYLYAIRSDGYAIKVSYEDSQGLGPMLIEPAHPGNLDFEIQYVLMPMRL